MQAAHERLTGIRQRLASTRRTGRTRDMDSAYLLSGFARCALCGASFFPMSRSHGRQRAFFYGCSANHKRGQAVCVNAMVMRMDRINEAVLDKLGDDVLRPAVVHAVLRGLFEVLQPRALNSVADRARADLADIEREIARLTDAVATGGDLESLIGALKARQMRRESLRHTIAAADEAKARHLDRKAIERVVYERLARWRALLTSHVEDGRALCREVLVGPIRFTPDREGRRYHFAGEATYAGLFSGVVNLAPFVASPRGVEEGRQLEPATFVVGIAA